MVAKAGQIEADVGLNLRPLEKDSRKAKTMFSDLSNNMKKVFKIQNIVASAAITGLSVKILKLGIDAEETQGKFDTAFRGIEEQAQQTARTLASSYNLSQTESKKLLSDTGDLLKGFGFTANKALKLSKDVQELSADLASYNNLQGGTTRASEILTKALLGERDSLVSLGIKVSDADVKQRLLEKGQQDLTGSTLLAAKAQATFELALKQSGDAQGDVARTSESTANQIRKLKAQVEDLTTNFGKFLLPALNAAAKAMNQFFEVMEIRKETKLINSLTAARDTLRDLEDTLLKAKQAGISNELFRDRIKEIDRYEKKIKELEEQLNSKSLFEVKDIKIKGEEAGKSFVEGFQKGFKDTFDLTKMYGGMGQAVVRNTGAASGYQYATGGTGFSMQQAIRDRMIAQAGQQGGGTTLKEWDKTIRTIGETRNIEDFKVKVEEIQYSLADAGIAIERFGMTIKDDFIASVGDALNGLNDAITSFTSAGSALARGDFIGAALGFLGGVTGLASSVNAFDSDDNTSITDKENTNAIKENTDAIRGLNETLFNVSGAVKVDVLRARTIASGINAQTGVRV